MTRSYSTRGRIDAISPDLTRTQTGRAYAWEVVRILIDSRAPAQEASGTYVSLSGAPFNQNSDNRVEEQAADATGVFELRKAVRRQHYCLGGLGLYSGGTFGETCAGGIVFFLPEEAEDPEFAHSFSIDRPKRIGDKLRAVQRQLSDGRLGEDAEYVMTGDHTHARLITPSPSTAFVHFSGLVATEIADGTSHRF